MKSSDIVESDYVEDTRRNGEGLGTGGRWSREGWGCEIKEEFSRKRILSVRLRTSIAIGVTRLCDILKSTCA